MTINYVSGDLLRDRVEALVNTVNCVGASGKGIAAQFKKAYRDNFRAYKKACDKKLIRPGVVHVFETGYLDKPKYIINFPTKDHWRGKSKIEDIKAGLDSLVAEVRKRGIESIAIPPLGCGLGGLHWSEVKPLIEEAFADLEVDVRVFEPGGAPKSEEMLVAGKKPQLTRAKALYLMAVNLYNRNKPRDEKLTKLVVHKLAYFLQEAGEPLKLSFDQRQYGPWAEEVRHVFHDMDGHYIAGFGDGVTKTHVRVINGSIQEAIKVLKREPGTLERLSRLQRLIEGYEDPYGMELLATVHWVMKTNAEAAEDPEAAVEAVQRWNERKASIFRPPQICVTWQRLIEQGWVRGAKQADEIPAHNEGM